MRDVYSKARVRLALTRSLPHRIVAAALGGSDGGVGGEVGTLGTGHVSLLHRARSDRHSRPQSPRS